MSFRHPGSIKLFQRNTNPLSVEGRMQSWERSILPVRVSLSTTERCWNLWFIYEFMSGMIILDSFVLLSLSSNPGCLSWFVPDLTLSVSLSLSLSCKMPFPSGTFDFFPLYGCLLHLCQVLQQSKTLCATEMYLKRTTLAFSPVSFAKRRGEGK